MKSIALKLWLGMMALVAVVLILLWLFQIVFLNNFYTQMRINEIKSSGLDIIKEIGNRQEFENRLDELAYNNNLTAELLDLGYNTVYTAGATGMNGQMPMLLLSFLLSKSFTKPILDITKVFMDMASGNLSARIKSGRKDEIGRLAETINYMEKELSKIDQLRKDLIANVSHELRTPLSLIKGYAETIRDIS